MAITGSITIPALIKRTGTGARYMRVFRNSIKLGIDGTQIQMKIIEGFWAKKKAREAFGKTEQFPIEDVYIYPHGTREGLADPDSVTRVQTNVIDILKDHIWKYKDMKQKMTDAIQKEQIWKQKLNELKSEVEKLKSDNLTYIKQISDMAKSSTG